MEATFLLNFLAALTFIFFFTQLKALVHPSEMWQADQDGGLTFWSDRSGFVCSELKWPFMSAVGLSCSQNRLPLT